MESGLQQPTTNFIFCKSGEHPETWYNPPPPPPHPLPAPGRPPPPTIALRTAGGPYLRQWMPPFEQNNINWLGNLNSVPCSGSQLPVSHNGVATLIPEQPTCWTQFSEATFCRSSSVSPSQWFFDENLCSRLPSRNSAVCTFITAVPGQWVSPYLKNRKKVK